MGGTDPEGIRELIELYRTQTSGQLKELAAAASASAAKDLERIAHKAAGASATCGMSAIVPLLRELEKQGRENHLDQASERVAQAEAALSRINAYLDQYLASLVQPAPSACSR
ncbi:MAG: Hpt domain-containing protein [Verrucomicrobia bacterium]|nr:Hpt domain-containing protein [Verrucomicrobiota bacterium]